MATTCTCDSIAARVGAAASVCVNRAAIIVRANIHRGGTCVATSAFHLNAIFEGSHDPFCVDRYAGVDPLACLPEVLHKDFPICPLVANVNGPPQRACFCVTSHDNVVASSRVSKVCDSAPTKQTVVLDIGAKCKRTPAKCSAPIYGDVLSVSRRFAKPVKRKRFEPCLTTFTELSLLVHRSRGAAVD